MITENKTILKIAAAQPEKGMSAEITAEKVIKTCTFTICDASGAVLTEGQAEGGATVRFTAKHQAECWSVERPVLYTLQADLCFCDGTAETVSDRFGYRWFSTDENYIYLNDYPYYVRAYIRGAAAHEHQNNCNLSEYEFYRKNIQMAKSYGFNAIRFHSVVPPEACFRAADELGILIHIEMREEDSEYDNLEEMLYGKNNFLSDRELIHIINSLYNHPSFMVYCVGNEIREPGKKPRIREIRDIVKKLDPSRLFIDTCADGEYDRTCVDFDVQHMGYYFPYAKHGDMFENTDNLLCVKALGGQPMETENDKNKIHRGLMFPRPVLAHEVCHYTSWRDFYALKEKFEKYGRPAPWWVDEEIKMLEAKGYKEDFAKTLQVTKDYQFRCWKIALEGIRASHFLAGFHMLQFADTDKYENSNGVVDCFDDPHGISTEAFRKFNADTVLLARLSKQIYAGGETVHIPVLLSQFKIHPCPSAEFYYSLTEGEKLVAEGTMKDMATGASGLYKLCGLELVLPATETGKKLVLTCRLSFADGTQTENSWELWVFPQCKKLDLAARCDMQADYLENTCRFDENAKLFITDKLDDELFNKLDNGADVLFIYRTDWTRHLLHKGMKAPQYSFRHTWERFKGVIWDRGTINGGIDDQDILNRYGFATDGQVNFQYYPLIEDSDKINLDDFPIAVHSLVSGLDKSSRDRFDPKKFGLSELMYDRTMRRFSYAFTLRAGKGRLLVTGFNFTGVDEREPASCAMLKALVAYCNSSDFAPQTTISTDELKAYLAGVAQEGPQKERMMTQYWQLDNEPVESMEYWTESERYLRET